MVERSKETDPFSHVSGGITSEVGTLNLAVSTGSWWEGLTKFTTDALNTDTGGDVFSYFFDVTEDIEEWIKEEYEYELKIVIDEGTGCEYIAISRGNLSTGTGIHPRLDSEGNHICNTM